MYFGHILNAHQNKWNPVNNFFFVSRSLVRLDSELSVLNQRCSVSFHDYGFNYSKSYLPDPIFLLPSK